MSQVTAKDDGADAEQIPFNGLIAYRINTIANLVLRRASQFYEVKTGLRFPQVWVLSGIGLREPATAREVTQAMSADEAQVSREIKSLIAGGYVRRWPDPKDRRRKILELTAKGRRGFRVGSSISQSRQAQLLEGFDAAEIETLYALLERIQANARTLEPLGKAGDPERSTPSSRI